MATASRHTASRHISVSIDRSADDVYRYASNPAHLHEWATGLAGKPLEDFGPLWMADSPMGKVTVEFVEPNKFGVLDHTVTLPSGETVLNPVRVLPDGENACEVVFTLRKRDMTDEAFEADTDAVVKDLTALKQRMEAGR